MLFLSVWFIWCPWGSHRSLLILSEEVQRDSGGLVPLGGRNWFLALRQKFPDLATCGQDSSSLSCQVKPCLFSKCKKTGEHFTNKGLVAAYPLSVNEGECCSGGQLLVVGYLLMVTLATWYFLE